MRIGRVSDVSQVPVPGLSMSRTSRLSHDAQGRNDVSGLLTCPTLASPTLDHAPACDSLHCTWSACHGWSKITHVRFVTCHMPHGYQIQIHEVEIMGQSLHGNRATQNLPRHEHWSHHARKFGFFTNNGDPGFNRGAPCCWSFSAYVSRKMIFLCNMGANITPAPRKPDPHVRSILENHAGACIH